MILWLVACHREELADSFTLTGTGITVEVTREPYGISVEDGAGHAVLGSTAGPQGDGYGPLGLTHGITTWENITTPGYFAFATNLDPWSDDWVVVGADATASSVDLELAPAASVDEKGHVDKDETARMHVVHTVTDGTLRVEATVGGVETPRAWEVGFDSPADEGFIGFGERFDKTDQRGVPVYSWLEEGGIGTGEGDIAGPDNPWPNGQAMAYYAVPFFLSTRGYGFWLDTTWRNQFDLDTDRADAWRAWHIGPSMAFEVYVPTPADARPWPYQVIDRFTAATGRPMVPPDWSFGPRRRLGMDSMADGMREIDAVRAEDLALTSADDTMHFLPDGGQIGIEDPIRQWTADCHDRGLRAIAYYNALFKLGDSPIADVVQEGIDNGYFLHDSTGAVESVFLISGSPVNVAQLDFTNPDAVTWYHGILNWAVDLGYSGWMYDFGEYVQPDDLTFDGRTGEEYHNAFPIDYDRAGHDALEAGPIAGDWMFFARSGYTGSNQYTPFVWSGDPAASFEDSDGLPSMVRGAINIGVSGVANWGSDIGGFHCLADGHRAADGELLTRWIEFGATTPDMHDENACSGATDSGEKATIWSAPEAKAAWSTYARLHTRLQPYWVTLANQAHESGAPAVRSLFLDFPDRPEYAGIDDEYFVGPALFVAPVLQRGAVSREVLFPPGAYLDWRNGTVYPGGSAATVPAPLAELPLFLRDGAVFPLLDPTIDTLSEETNPDVIGPTDVADVWDAVGFVTLDTRAASFVTSTGETLQVSWAGAFSPDGLTEVDEAALSTCDACYRVDTVGDAQRVRVSTSQGEVLAGGLQLRKITPRRVRWDLYLTE